jgi:hypothetical protein
MYTGWDMTEKITPEELKAYVRYDAESGEVIRLSTGRPVGVSIKKRGGHRTFTLRINRAPIYVFVHRAVWALVHGSWPKYQIDHIDRDTSNNRIENLRDVPGGVNQQNRAPIGEVPYLGVRFLRGKYEARIKKDGRQIQVGTFSSAKAAAKARDRMAVALFGENATLNFPQNFSPM